MELSKEVLDGLQLAGNSSAVDDATFRKIAKKLFENLDQQSKVVNRQADQSEAAGRQVKCAEAALSCLAVESSKLDISVESLSEILDDCQFNSERQSLILKLYDSHKQSIRSTLCRIESLATSQIVDVSWSLEYYIKSNQLEKINQLQYLVALKVKEPDCEEIKEVQMNCSLEQLEDLVGKLREAVRCVEKQTG